MLDILNEPTGSAYASLIDCGVTKCKYAQVVFYREPESYLESAHSFLRQIEPHVVKRMLDVSGH